MTASDILEVLLEELGKIAPEIDLNSVDPTADLREALDIDSMDFLNFVTALHHRYDIELPEIDYPKLRTLDSAADYIQTKLNQKQVRA
jgi:acyl carrier protein